MLNQDERTRIMVEAYGEVCTKTIAAKILGRTLPTVNTMITDGRISAACEGSMVDVRSLAKYIMAPAKEDFDANEQHEAAIAAIAAIAAGSGYVKVEYEYFDMATCSGYGTEYYVEWSDYLWMYYSA